MADASFIRDQFDKFRRKIQGRCLCAERSMAPPTWEDKAAASNLSTPLEPIEWSITVAGTDLQPGAVREIIQEFRDLATSAAVAYELFGREQSDGFTAWLDEIASRRPDDIVTVRSEQVSGAVVSVAHAERITDCVLSSQLLCEDLDGSLLARPDLDAAVRLTAGTGVTTNSDRIDAYLKEIRGKTGQRLTRKDLWVMGGYSEATEFERWQRDDPKATAKAREFFEDLLTRRPHLSQEN
jgi:hypothetical protein